MGIFHIYFENIIESKLVLKNIAIQMKSKVKITAFLFAIIGIMPNHALACPDDQYNDCSLLICGCRPKIGGIVGQVAEGAKATVNDAAHFGNDVVMVVVKGTSDVVTTVSKAGNDIVANYSKAWVDTTEQAKRSFDTPIGRAAIASEDSATQLREVAGLVGDMADKLANLHTVFLTEVIPQWVSSLKLNGEAMNQSLQNADDNLRWAKWALIASVIVTLATTVWQIWIAHDYKLENDTQQTDALLIMKEQLKASQELNKQLTTDSMQLKKDLVKLQQSVETLHANQSAKLIAKQVAK